jgi:N-methylhydantoinase B/oxoprolinase/acetone carboxylase alpha subunit
LAGRGDIRAQLGALSVGEKRLTQLLDRYDVETVDAAITELKAGSERLMRAHIGWRGFNRNTQSRPLQRLQTVLQELFGLRDVY